MKSYILSTSYKNDWKFITIQIGSNDQCASCNSSITDHVTAAAYGQYVEAAIERIKAEIPKTVVNLRKSFNTIFHEANLTKCSVVGTFKVSGVFPLSAGQAYCVPNGILENKSECSCSSSAENLAKMDALSDGRSLIVKSVYWMLIK